MNKYTEVLNLNCWSQNHHCSRHSLQRMNKYTEVLNLNCWSQNHHCSRHCLQRMNKYTEVLNLNCWSQNHHCLRHSLQRMNKYTEVLDLNCWSQNHHCSFFSVTGLFRLSPRLCPSTAGCSPPSMSSIVFCLLLSCFTFHLGLVHPLQDVALHQCLPLSSVCCFPDPGGSLLPCYVVLPSSAWSSSWSLPSPWLPLCAAFGPSIVRHSCYMSGSSPLCFNV